MVHCAMIAPHFAAMFPARIFERDDDMKRARWSGQVLARGILVLAPLLAWAAPAGAQSANGPVAATPVDPWSRLLIVITRPAPEAAEESPYDAAQRDNPAAVQEEATDTLASEEMVGHVVSSTDLDQEAPRASIWSSLFGTLVPPATVKPPANSLLPARNVVTAAKAQSLPTRVEILEGPASLAVSTSASTSAPVSSPLDKSAGGGSGEVKTRVGYEVNNLTLYGTGGLGAAESTGAVSVYDNIAVGSTYNVPLGIVKGDSLGATVEMNNAATVTTGIELRAPMGDYQRFISVQRAASPDSEASGVVKAGVLGKF